MPLLSTTCLPRAGAALLAACACFAHAAPIGAPRVPPAASAPDTAPARTAGEYLRGIAERLVSANPDITYLDPAPNPVPAILVLEIEVEADGRLRDVRVLRRPAFEDMQDTIQIAIDAVRRAGSFGDASHVPPPWKFKEYFLFDEDRRFKPRELD